MENSVFQILVLIISGVGTVALFFGTLSFNRATRDKEKTDKTLDQIFKTLSELKVELVKIASNNKLVERSLEHLEKRIDAEHELIMKNSRGLESFVKFKHKTENDREHIQGIIEQFEEKLKEKA